MGKVRAFLIGIELSGAIEKAVGVPHLDEGSQVDVQVGRGLRQGTPAIGEVDREGFPRDGRKVRGAVRSRVRGYPSHLGYCVGWTHLIPSLCRVSFPTRQSLPEGQAVMIGTYRRPSDNARITISATGIEFYAVRFADDTSTKRAATMTGRDTRALIERQGLVPETDPTAAPDPTGRARTLELDRQITQRAIDTVAAHLDTAIEPAAPADPPIGSDADLAVADDLWHLQHDGFCVVCRRPLADPDVSCCGPCQDRAAKVARDRAATEAGILNAKPRVTRSTYGMAIQSAVRALTDDCQATLVSFGVADTFFTCPARTADGTPPTVYGFVTVDETDAAPYDRYYRFVRVDDQRAAKARYRESIQP